MLAPARRGPAPARELQSPDPYSPAPILPPVPPLPLPPPPPPAAVQAQPVGLPLQPLLHAAASRSVSPPPPPPLPAPQDRLQSPPRCVAVGGGRHNPPRAAALAGADEPPRRRSEQDPHGEGGAPAAPSGSEAESGDLKAQLTEAAGRLADSESELELERGLVERYAAAHAGARRQAEELRRERDLLAEQCRQLAAQHKLLSEDVHNAESAAAAARAELAGVVGTLRRARSAGLQRVGSRRSCAATVQAEDDGAPQHLLHEAGSAAQLGHSCRAPAAADATAPLHLLQRGELARRGSLGRRASLLPREAAHRRGSVYSTAPPASEVDEIRAIPSILEPDGLDRGTSAAALRSRSVAESGVSAAALAEGCAASSSFLSAPAVHRGASSPSMRQHSVAECGASVSALAADQAVSASFLSAPMMHRGTSAAALRQAERGTSCMQPQGAERGTSCSALAAVDRGTSSPALQRHAADCGTSCSALAAVDRGTSSPSLQRHAVECGTSCSALAAVDRGTSSPTLQRHAVECGTSCSAMSAVDRGTSSPTLHRHAAERGASVSPQGGADDSSQTLERVRTQPTALGTTLRDREAAVYAEANALLAEAEVHLERLRREQSEALAAARQRVESLASRPEAESSLVAAEEHLRGLEREQTERLAAAEATVRSLRNADYLERGAEDRARGDFEAMRRDVLGGAFGTRTCSAYAGSSSRRSSWETRGAVASSALRPWNSPEPRDAAELPNRGCHPTVPQFEADEMKGLPAPWPPPRSLSCCAGGGHRLPSAAAPSGSGHDASDDAVSSSGHPEPLAGAGELLAEAQAVERELQLAQEDAAEAAAEADALRVRCAELAALAQRLQQELRDSEQAREELKEALGRAEAEAAAERQRRADDTQKAELWRDHLEAKLRGAEKMRDNEALRRGELEEAIYAVPDTGGGARQERPARGGVGRPPFYPPGRSPPRQGRTSASPPGRHPVSPPPARSLSPQSPRPRRPLRSLSAAPPSPPRWRAPWEKHAQYAGGPLSPPPAASRRRRTVSPPRPPLMHALPVRQRRQRRAGGMPRHRRAEGAARGLADTAWHSAAAAMAAASVPVGDSRRISPRRRAPS
eukprot:TRINITY_DN421_c0_g1_i1.p1 TRINITY_DN421_c0_g1~~TRINITY_DN421_c0_g1_i1.p1  ORF type:complete len:1100 (+),score=126.14 TRINITY_DN421_c0_g1_i1:97-3396(+)